MGLSLTPLPRLVLRAGYARLRSPLAGRYWIMVEANSLGGAQYLWNDANGDGIWTPAETGPLVLRFGSPYSGIDGNLRRPYADEFNVGAETTLPQGFRMSLRLFRRDEKDRIAAINVGVPDAAFSPVETLDPGPDGVRGTFDDQNLTVYAQDPSTLGQDWYLLTNPPGLRMRNQGLVAEITGHWRLVAVQASFMAVKSRGPTNPGNGVLENDAGVAGALYQDPNTLIHADGRTYFDRAYVGKVRMSTTLPRRFGGLELANTADYLDGLAFGRRLLIKGLPQGPFLVAATVRGSPEGGNRTEYLLNWNLRVGRTLRFSRGGLGLSMDVLNVLNGGAKMQESDTTGPLFNQRLPLALQPPRFVRFTIEYLF